MDSRTSKSIKNAKVNLIYYLLQIIIGFWLRKVFYDYLGSEVLGLDTTAASLLQFLNIAESGVGTAVAFFLYTPFYNNDTITINKIVSLQGWIYRRIGLLIILVSIILMLCFPWIFKDIKVPLWYTYAVFITLLIGNMLGYFVNYKQSVLSAAQEAYKVVKVTQFSNLFFKLVLIFVLPYSSNPFALYIATTLCGYLIGSIWLNHIIKKEFPWLETMQYKGSELLKEYPDVLKKTKQLFVHKVGGFIVFQCTPLIMYSFCSLTTIAYFGNYLAVTDKAQNLLSQVFTSTTASIGNLVASKDKSRVLSVFWELTDSRLCISLISLFVIFSITEPFISIWLSSDYLLSHTLLILIIINAFLLINRGTVDSYKSALGLFADVWAPIIEGMINLSVAYIGGLLFGIEGVLLGTTTSSILVSYIWRPYYTFSRGLELNSIKFYFIPYLYRIILVVFSTVSLYYILRLVDNNINNYLSLLKYSILITTVASFYFYIIFSFFTSGMKDFNKRLFAIAKLRFIHNKN